MKEQVIWTAAALVLCAAVPAKAAASANRVTAIEVDGPRIVVHGTQNPISALSSWPNRPAWWSISPART